MEMYIEMNFDEWLEKVKAGFAANSIALPDDIELLQLAYMECSADQKSIETFIEENKLQ